MPFNFRLLTGLRLKNGVERSDFAKLLGVTYNHVLKIESGKREPSLALLRKIAKYTGAPADAFLGDEDESSPESLNGPGRITCLMDLIDDLNRERFTLKSLERRLLEVEKQRDHILAVNVLQEKFIAMLRQDMSPVERGKKTAALAREAIRTGEVRFDEVQAALHLNRRTLRQWLESEMGEYRCRLFDDRTVMATTPTEAGIKLRCFDCEAKAKEDCRGFGESSYPENLFVLISILEANGIYKRNEQAALLRDSFDMDITPHQLSEALSRQKRGKKVSEDLTNL
ncbi:MAG: helix-turn-helix transcriptional regulator [Synergistaceae bacterium]|jgi:transcriptional regulator with XRE-family HTH domain|nr:helix-turn-helix transcriptional regulator [Synergistaceae bacterium]